VEIQVAQNILREEGIKGRLILGRNSTEERRKEQLEDRIVSVFLRKKERNYRSSWEEVVEKGISSKIY